MALGRAIIDELQIDTRGELLQRWMAHHLAETLQKVDSAAGEQKAQFEGEAIDLILRLWGHRRALPDSVDPLSGYRDAIQVLKLLHPEANPWRRFGNGQPDQKILFALFEAMSRAMVGALAMTGMKQIKEPTAAEVAHLDPVESQLLEMLSQWSSMLKHPSGPSIVVVKGFDEESDDGTLGISIEAPEVEPSSEPSAQEFQIIVAENLKRFHAELGTLIDQWEAKNAAG